MESWLFAVHTFEENHCGTIHSSGQIVNGIPLNGGDFCIREFGSKMLRLFDLIFVERRNLQGGIIRL